MVSLNSRYFDIFAFLLTASFAFHFEWKANELCWGLWISSLLTGWVVILSSVLRGLVHLAGIPLFHDEELNEQTDPLSSFLRTKALGKKARSARAITSGWPLKIRLIGTLGIGVFTWLHFTFFHTVHAALMSFFLQMEPLHLFGPNGFINADREDILAFLVIHYWPMILGTFVARRGIIFGGNPGTNLKAIYQGVLRIHVFILLSGFLFFLIHFGIETYQRVLLLILLFLFFFPAHWLRRQSA